MTSPILLKFRPYARLLTMLGDQLIKDERIALVELIKNSYDADASWVKVTFSKFGDLFEVTPSSVITIEDDGTGMKRDVLENHWVSAKVVWSPKSSTVSWLSPATLPRRGQGKMTGIPA